MVFIYCKNLRLTIFTNLFFYSGIGIKVGNEMKRDPVYCHQTTHFSILFITTNHPYQKLTLLLEQEIDKQFFLKKKGKGKERKEKLQ